MKINEKRGERFKGEKQGKKQRREDIESLKIQQMIRGQENNCSPMGLYSEVNPSRTRSGHQSYNHRGNMRKQKTEKRSMSYDRDKVRKQKAV